MRRAESAQPGARVLAVADSDSYLKWAAGLLDTLPGAWERRLAVVRSPIAPTRAQVENAVSATSSAGRLPPTLTVRGLRGMVGAYRPDVLLLACTGPVADVLSGIVVAGTNRRGRRPVVVSGLPGISVPASRRAWCYRWAVDLLVVHSRREAGEYAALGRSLGISGRVGLAVLPFLRGGSVRVTPGVRDCVLFASQAMVPPDRQARTRVLRALASLAELRPDLRVVVKLRSATGELQTHREHLPYDELWRDLVAAGEVRGGMVHFETGPLRPHLEHAVGLVTVSSTAALEAVDAGVPLLVLSDFGVDAGLCNLAFEGSGCLGTLDDLEKADFRIPDPGWCAQNYFHDPGASDWQHHLGDLLDASRAGALPAPVRLPSGAAQASPSRSRLRLMVPPGPYRRAVRVYRRINLHLRTTRSRH